MPRDGVPGEALAARGGARRGGGRSRVTVAGLAGRGALVQGAPVVGGRPQDEPDRAARAALEDGGRTGRGRRVTVTRLGENAGRLAARLRGHGGRVTGRVPGDRIATGRGHGVHGMTSAPGRRSAATQVHGVHGMTTAPGHRNAATRGHGGRVTVRGPGRPIAGVRGRRGSGTAIPAGATGDRPVVSVVSETARGAGGRVHGKSGIGEHAMGHRDVSGARPGGARPGRAGRAGGRPRGSFARAGWSCRRG
jgi:hypothetical protein